MSLCLVKNANITTPIADNLLRCFVKDYNIIHSVERVKAFTDAYDVLLEIEHTSDTVEYILRLY